MSNDDNTADAGGLSTIEMVAAGTSAVIVVSGAIFWTIQIIGVLEMLEMAYG